MKKEKKRGKETEKRRTKGISEGWSSERKYKKKYDKIKKKGWKWGKRRNSFVCVLYANYTNEIKQKTNKTNSVAFSPQANYTE
jgi:hypothetical protein